METEKLFSFKIVITGPKSSGKTCLIRRYMQNFSHSTSKNLYDLRFDYGNFPIDVIKEVSEGNVENSQNSIQIVQMTRLFDHPISCLVSLSMWDCPSQEDIDLKNLYYQDVDAVIVVGDITSENVLDEVNNFKEEFFRLATVSLHHYSYRRTVACDNASYEPARSDTPVFLYLNKYDLLTSQQTDNIKTVCQKAEEIYKFTGSVSISCRVDDNSVYHAFNSLIRRLIDRKIEEEIARSMRLNITEMKSISYNAQTSIPVHSSYFENIGDRKVDFRLSALAESGLLIADWFVKLSQKMQRFWLLWQYYSRQRLKCTDPIVSPIGRLLFYCKSNFGGLSVGEMDFPDNFREDHPSLDVSQRMIAILSNKDLKTIVSKVEEQEFWDQFENDLTRIGEFEYDNCDYSHFGDQKVLAIIINFYNMQIAPACFVVKQYIRVVSQIIQYLKHEIPQKVLQKTCQSNIARRNLTKIRELEYKLHDLNCLCQNINDSNYLQAHAIEITGAE